MAGVLLGPPLVCEHSYGEEEQRSRLFPKASPLSLFSSFLSAVPSWRLLQRPVWHIRMAIRKPRELTAKTFLKSPGPWPACLLLATYAGVFLRLSVVVSAGLLVLRGRTWEEWATTFWPDQKLIHDSAADSRYQLSNILVEFFSIFMFMFPTVINLSSK